MSKLKKYFSTCIFPRHNSFLMGAASVLNLAGNHRRYTYAETAEEADAKALAKVWEEVGQDLRYAMQMNPVKNKTVKKILIIYLITSHVRKYPARRIRR